MLFNIYHITTIAFVMNQIEVFSNQKICGYYDIQNNITIGTENNPIYNEDLQQLLVEFFNWLQNFLMGNDPLNIQYQTLNSDTFLFRSKGYLKEILISDISRLKFEPQLLKHDTPPNSMYFGLFIRSESLEISGYYDWNFNLIDEMSFNGAGELGIATYGLNISCEAYVWTFHDDSMFIPWIKINYNITRVQVQIEGMYGGGPISKLINKILNDVLIKILNQYKNLITGILSLLSNFLINRNLNSVSINNITDIIHHIIGK